MHTVNISYVAFTHTHNIYIFRSYFLVFAILFFMFNIYYNICVLCVLHVSMCICYVCVACVHVCMCTYTHVHMQHTQYTYIIIYVY